MQPTTSMASKYRFLFKVPGAGYASFFLILTGFAIGLLQSIIDLTNIPYSVVICIFVFGLVPFFVNIFSKWYMLRNFRVTSFRRLNHLSLLENYFFLASAGIGALISYLENSPQTYALMIYSALSLNIFIRSTILSTFTPGSLFRGFLAGLIEPLCRGLALPLLFPTFFSLQAIMISSSIGVVLSGVSLFILLRPIKEKVSPLRLAGGFVSALLVGDESFLEEMLERLSSEYSGISEAFLFRRVDGKKIAVIIPPFHFGPFRSVGSSMLNAYIENELQRYGIDGVVLKGCTGHEANLVSNDESKRICSEIIENIINNDSNFTNIICYYPQTKHGRVTMLGLTLDGKTILVPTLHPDPMEDLPQIISHIANHYNVSVVDPHNSYSNRFSGLTEEDVTSIIESIGFVIKNDKKICGKFKMGFKRTVPLNYGLSDGLGVGGFSLLGLEILEKKIALAIIDGNNALPAVRDAVIQRLRSDGWSMIELFTTDTHMVNGVSLGGKGYYAIGEKISANEVSEIFGKLSKDLLADLKEAEVKYLKIRHEFSKIFSEDMLTRLAKKSSYLLIIYLLLMVLSFLIPLVVF